MGAGQRPRCPRYRAQYLGQRERESVCVHVCGVRVCACVCASHTHALSIQCEVGIWDDGPGYIAGQVTYTEPQVSDLPKPSAAAGKLLSDAKYSVTLEAYANGTPAPTELIGGRLTMTIRSPLTPTTFSYPCSHSPEV